MLPLPAGMGLIFHSVYIVTYGVLVSSFHLWPKVCSGEGEHYIIAASGILIVFCASCLTEFFTFLVGLRGKIQCPLILREFLHGFISITAKGGKKWERSHIFKLSRNQEFVDLLGQLSAFA